MIQRKCETCKKIFLVWPYQPKMGEGKYCSKQCYWSHKKINQLGKNNPNYRHGDIKKYCAKCKKIFVITYKNQRFCSRKCLDTINLRNKGTRYECLARQRLINENYFVIRSSGSLTCFDLVAIKPKKIKLIQIKSTTKKIQSFLKHRRLINEIKKIKNVKCPENCIKELWIWENNNIFKNFQIIKIGHGNG